MIQMRTRLKREKTNNMSVIFAGSPVMAYVKESWLSVIHQRIYIAVETEKSARYNCTEIERGIRFIYILNFKQIHITLRLPPTFTASLLTHILYSINHIIHPLLHSSFVVASQLNALFLYKAHHQWVLLTVCCWTAQSRSWGGAE